MYVVFYNGISDKNNFVALIDLICQVYVVFCDWISNKNNLSPIIDLIYPVHIAFYDGVSDINNLSKSNMPNVRITLQWNIQPKQPVEI